MINRLRILVALAALVAAPAAFATAKGTPVHATGTLMDAMCGADVKAQADADKHTKECALMAQCAESGYGIVVDGKFHKFDAAGSKKAAAILASTTKTDHLAATVDGTLESDGTITVASLTEAK